MVTNRFAIICVVWDKNMSAIRTPESQNLKCERTLVAGRVVCAATR